MGGLVARYYIENIGKDENVDKLITICTPHWGSELANAPDILATVLGEHKLCDHDLKTNSRIYGGSDSEFVDCLICSNGYKLTDELNWSTQRTTKYYAIAGIADSNLLSECNNILIEISTSNTTYENLDLNIRQKVIERGTTLTAAFSVITANDNVVGFLSQIGWKKGTTVYAPQNIIEFEKICINIDTDGGNGLLDHFHGKMPHRRVVMKTVSDFLND